MAAGPALEMWSRQSGSAESPDGRTRILTMQRAFTVTLAASDALEVVYQAAGLPLVGDLYPGAFAVICRRLYPQRVSPILAIVACDYSGEVGPTGDVTSSPIDWTPKISWGVATTDEAIDEDWDGNPIVTVNGEPIDGITERLSDDVVTIERNFLSINRYALRLYRRAVNSDIFLDWPPGTARLIDDRNEAVFINGTIAYWRVTAQIQFREPFRTTPEKAWYKRVRHEGYYDRETALSKPKVAWDKNKNPTTRPVLLDEFGIQIPIEPSELNPQAVWLEFKTLGSLPYNALGLI